MKTAILADIHGNIEALQAVLKDAREQRCTDYCCVGDIVGYGANPKECFELVRSLNMPCVKGEIDDFCSNEDSLDVLELQAAAAVAWTRRQLGLEDKEWLREQKYTRLVANFSLVHATLDEPQRWGYVFDKLAAAASFAFQRIPVCFNGHTHIPVAFIRDSVVRGGTYSTFRVEPSRKYFVNVGSVGWPADGDPRAGYVIYDQDEGTIELRRVDYDIPTVQKKILAAGLPAVLAEKLPIGTGPFDRWYDPFDRLKINRPPEQPAPALEKRRATVWTKLSGWLGGS